MLEKRCVSNIVHWQSYKTVAVKEENTGKVKYSTDRKLGEQVNSVKYLVFHHCVVLEHMGKGCIRRKKLKCTVSSANKSDGEHECSEGKMRMKTSHVRFMISVMGVTLRY
jgi:hypothetical protein